MFRNHWEGKLPAIDRRTFCCALCSTAALSFSGIGWAQSAGGPAVGDLAGVLDDLTDVEDDYVCGTLEDFALDALEIDDFGAGEPFQEYRDRLRDELDITDFGTASAHLRWFPKHSLTKDSGAATLACGFLPGATDKQKKRVIDAANSWILGPVKDLIQFRFGYDDQLDKAQVRILVGYPGYKALVGTEALKAKPGEPTVWLYEGLQKKKVAHEFGHVLALHHEHQHPSRKGTLNEQAVIDYFVMQEKWTPGQIQDAILSTWGNEQRCVGHPDFTTDSIMSYDIPAKLTLDKKHIVMASKVSADDLECVAGLYSQPG